MSYRKLKILWVSIYAKLMIILQISHIVIFVLKNKIYKMKHTKILRVFFFGLFVFKSNSHNVYKILRRMKKKYEKYQKKTPTITKNQHIPDQHEGLTLL